MYGRLEKHGDHSVHVRYALINICGCAISADEHPMLNSAFFAEFSMAQLYSYQLTKVILRLIHLLDLFLLLSGRVSK